MVLNFRPQFLHTSLGASRIGAINIAGKLCAFVFIGTRRGAIRVLRNLPIEPPYLHGHSFDRFKQPRKHLMRSGVMKVLFAVMFLVTAASESLAAETFPPG